MSYIRLLSSHITFNPLFKSLYRASDAFSILDLCNTRLMLATNNSALWAFKNENSCRSIPVWLSFSVGNKNIFSTKQQFKVTKQTHYYSSPSALYSNMAQVAKPMTFDITDVQPDVHILFESFICFRSVHRTTLLHVRRSHILVYRWLASFVSFSRLTVHGHYEL